MTQPTPPVSPTPAIEIAALTRSFGSTLALNGLNLTVDRGDLFGFIGSNGAGKTTTLRILATFLAPSSGSARVLGHDVLCDAQAVRHAIGYLPDFFGVYQDMEVTEYLDFFAACYRIRANQREKTVNDVLELVGLTEKRGSLIATLSRGMQQRLGLARVLVHDPQVLLLDEPASGLDPRARIEMMAILQELQRLGKTILISSHILSELETLCNRVAIIEKGRLIYTGPVQGIRDQLAAGRVFRVRVAGDPSPAIDLLRAQPHIQTVEPENRHVRVMLRDHDTDPGCIAHTLVHAGFTLLGLEEEELGLEEVFLRVTRGENP